LNVKRIVIAGRKENIYVFDKYKDKFEIKGFSCPNLLIKYVILNRLYKLLCLNSDDIILFTNNYSALIKKCKHIIVIHDLIQLRKHYTPFLFQLQRRLFMPRSVAIADKIITISQWVKSDVEKHFSIKNKEKIVAIYNYFNFRKYENTLVEEDIVKIADEKSFFLIVSSNLPYKNTITIFKSFNIFCQTTDNVNLICVGKISGELKEYYDQLPLNVKDRIIAVHAITNGSLGYLYKKTCGYISATLFEGLGMPIVEAMYFNAPVLVSDIEVIKEVSANKAIYFSPLEYRTLSQFMGKVYTEGRIYNYQSMIKEMFSINNTINRYIKVINEMNLKPDFIKND
jgi:glycosyltransferase involved in cell wall biosynthesis